MSDILSIIGEVKEAYDTLQGPTDREREFFTSSPVDHEDANNDALNRINKKDLADKYLVPSSKFSKDWLDYFQE